MSKFNLVSSLFLLLIGCSGGGVEDNRLITDLPARSQICNSGLQERTYPCNIISCTEVSTCGSVAPEIAKQTANGADGIILTEILPASCAVSKIESRDAALPDGLCTPENSPLVRVALKVSESVDATTVSTSCLNFNEESKECAQCISGYGIANSASSGKRCIPMNDVNCLAVSSSFDWTKDDVGVGKCSVCEKGYYNGSGECKDCTGQGALPACKIYSSDLNCVGTDSDSKCAVCADGYYLLDSNKTCATLGEGCSLGNDKFKCIACIKPNEFPVADFTKCMALPENCLMLNSSTTDPICAYCEPGFSPIATDADCVPYPANCVVSLRAGTCELCEVGYYTNGQICQKNPSGCAIAVNKNNNPNCIRCSAGYQSTQTEVCELVIPGVTTLPNCMVAKSNVSTHCEICNAGYGPVNGTCTPWPANCHLGSFVSGEDNDCILCKSGHSVVAGGQCQAWPENCKVAPQVQVGGVTCKGCDVGYHWSGTACIHCADTEIWNPSARKCVAKPANCSQASISGSEVVCAVCNGGHQLNSEKECVATPEFCSVVDPSSTVSSVTCHTCYSGYDDVGGVCKAACGSGKTRNSSGNCLSLPEHCATIDPNSTSSLISCKNCEAGYNIYSTVISEGATKNTCKKA